MHSSHVGWESEVNLQSWGFWLLNVFVLFQLVAIYHSHAVETEFRAIGVWFHYVLHHISHLAPHTSTPNNLLSVRMPFVITSTLTLAGTWLQDVKFLSEPSFEVSVQFLTFRRTPSVLLIKANGRKYWRKMARLFVKQKCTCLYF